MPDPRRIYYDHEPAYLRVAAAGGTGWADCCPSTDAYDDLGAFLASELAPPPGARALDLGCGGGQATLMLAEHGYQALGVDFAETAIALARANAARAGSLASFQRMDALAPGELEADAFDLVVDNHVLHCVLPGDRERFLATAFQALRPGGLLFSTTMSCEGAFDAAAMGADPLTRIARNRTRYWVGQAELVAELAAAGFELEDLKVLPQGTPTGDRLVTCSRRR